MTQVRGGIFAGDDPFDIVRRWMAEAEKTEVNDPNAMALATVDAQGMPNVRVVLLKEIEQDCFVFYTNYESRKGQEIAQSGKAAFVLHWKTLARQIRVRGTVTKEDGPQADAYYASRSLGSRHGAWASRQSRPLDSRETLLAQVERVAAEQGDSPTRPPFWGGFRIKPQEIEFWADGENRLHDRYHWSKNGNNNDWMVNLLSP